MKRNILLTIVLFMIIFCLSGCKKEVFAINYVLNGGINDERNVNSYNEGDEPLTLYYPTKENCEFRGWYLDEEFTGSLVKEIVASQEDVTLYAKWSYKVITSTMINDVSNFINDYLNNEIGKEVNSDISLIVEEPLYDLDIVWLSSNTDVLSNEGVYLHPKVDTYIMLKYTINSDSLEPTSFYYEFKVLHDESIIRVDKTIFSSYFYYAAIEAKETRCSVTFISNDDPLGTVNYEADHKYFYGEEITASVNESGKFLFWVENNIIVSKNNEYQFFVTTNHTLIAYFIPLDKSAVVFLDINNEIVDIVLVNKGEIATTNKQVMSKLGFNFLGFDAIKATEDVHYQYAVYATNENQSLVKVRYGYFPEAENRYKHVLFGDSVTVGCDDEGFSYWMINEDIISYEKNYTFAVFNKEIEIIAIITDQNAKKFSASLAELIIINDELLIFGSFSNPNNLPVIDKGLIISFGAENSNKKIYSWTDSEQIHITQTSNNNGFALLYKHQADEIVNACVYIVTNNGTAEKPVYIYHYSPIKTYCSLSEK